MHGDAARAKHPSLGWNRSTRATRPPRKPDQRERDNGARNGSVDSGSGHRGVAAAVVTGIARGESPWFAGIAALATAARPGVARARVRTGSGVVTRVARPVA